MLYVCITSAARASAPTWCVTRATEGRGGVCVCVDQATLAAVIGIFIISPSPLSRGGNSEPCPGARTGVLSIPQPPWPGRKCTRSDRTALKSTRLPYPFDPPGQAGSRTVGGDNGLTVCCNSRRLPGPWVGAPRHWRRTEPQTPRPTQPS